MYDCEGYVTRYGVKCTDGVTIRQGAFADQNGARVPVVWMHIHDDVEAVLGHADLEARDDGVYGKISFNGTEAGIAAKELVSHGDVSAFSIHANHLTRNKFTNVISHGNIKEISLVLAGANPKAYIEKLNLTHSDDGDDFDDANIFTAGDITLAHADEEKKEDPEVKDEDLKHEDQKKEENPEGNEKTVKDVLDTLNEEQQAAVAYIIGKALEEKGGSVEHNDDDDEEDNPDMKHNVFDPENAAAPTLSHDDMQKILKDAKRLGSLKQAVLEHCEADGDDAEALQDVIQHADGDYGVTNVGYLFPDARNMTNEPIFIQRDQTWVSQVMGKVHRTPFSRIKSIFADITEDEARAKGYIKGKLKKEEVFSLLKRTTTPTTIYKKQKMDRDDQLDITDFNVVAWLKSEMRMMLNEELARAILIGDGRLASSDDKINEQNIRPIWTDSELFTVKYPVNAGTSDAEHAKNFIKAVVKSRKLYKGSGNPDLYTTEDMLTEMLMLEDTTGRVIYDTVEKLRTALRVNSIVTIESMVGLTRSDDAGKTQALDALLVNLNDYNVGADKGGEVSMFDDFDIDYNQYKYLMETRCSGALTRPYAAIAFEVQKD
jgi:HK97 family phage prohead protease/HK97 family phage major capsid protein